MASCDIKILDVGCYTHCGNVVLPIKAIQQGIHQLEFKWRGNTYCQDIMGIHGHPFKFENRFNECSKNIKFTIIQPDGTCYLDISTLATIFRLDNSIGKDLTQKINYDKFLSFCDNCSLEDFV